MLLLKKYFFKFLFHKIVLKMILKFNAIHFTTYISMTNGTAKKTTGIYLV